MKIKVVVLATTALTLLGAIAARADGPDPAAYAFILNGLVVYDDGDGRAWIQEKTLTQNQVVVLKRGQSVGPWTLTRIMPGRVELDGPGGKIAVLLSDGSGGGTRSAAAGPPASAGPATPYSGAAPTVQPTAASAPTAMPGAPTPQVGTQAPATVPATTSPTPAAASQPASAPQIAAPTQAPARATPTVRESRETQPGNQGGGLFFPVGDPRRRENMRQFFGNGATR